MEYNNQCTLSLSNVKNPIYLHDGQVTGIEMNEYQLCLYFDEGLFMTESTCERSGKAKLIVPIKGIDSVDIKKTRSHCIFHHYFGIETFSSVAALKRKLNKSYSITCIDESYAATLMFLVLDIRHPHRRSHEIIRIELFPTDDIQYLWNK